MKGKVRVAAVQFAVTDDVLANLATCLRMIDEAARHQPALIVLPEFCNHQAWYDSPAHCYAVAVPFDGDFLQAIAAKAAERRCYVKLNVTLQRAEGKVTGTNLLFDPAGQCVGVTDKQTLMGNENNFLERATEHGPIVDTAAGPIGQIGKIGMYCCADGLLNETARTLSLRGAEVLANSLNSFAECEASLHVPVRAAENRVFVVAANKVGPLVPPAVLEPLSRKIGVPADRLCGAGESQIVAPDGTVLAKAPKTGEAVVVAEIDPARAADKRRPDGTDVFANRRPALYRPIVSAPATRHYTPGAAEITAAVFQPAHQGEAAIAEAAAAIRQANAALIVLPELFCFRDGLVEDPAAAAARSHTAIGALCAALVDSQACIATSLVETTPQGFAHTGVLLDRGIRAAAECNG
jgi:predicted amidohydrolase